MPAFTNDKKWPRSRGRAQGHPRRPADRLSDLQETLECYPPAISGPVQRKELFNQLCYDLVDEQRASTSVISISSKQAVSCEL